jgi:hypothetical protein
VFRRRNRVASSVPTRSITIDRHFLLDPAMAGDDLVDQNRHVKTEGFDARSNFADLSETLQARVGGVTSPRLAGQPVPDW